MSLVEQLDALEGFDPTTYEFMHPPDTFELLSKKCLVKDFNTMYGVKPYTYLDSDPNYLLSSYGKRDLNLYLKKEEIRTPCFLKLKETKGVGYEIKYVFVTWKPPKQTKLDDPKI